MAITETTVSGLCISLQCLCTRTDTSKLVFISKKEQVVDFNRRDAAAAAAALDDMINA